MTIQSTSNKVTYYGTGGVGPFPINFKFFQNSDIVVTRTSTTGVVTTLQDIVDYTLTGAGSSGGSLTLVAALSGGPPAEILVIRRIIPFTQLTSIRNQTAYFPSLHEDVFDRLEMQIQQVDELAGTVNVTVSSAAINTIPLLESDVSGGDATIDINGLSAVFVSKNDASANKLHIIDSSGATIEHLTEYRDGLQIMDETVLLVINAARTNWKKVS